MSLRDTPLGFELLNESLGFKLDALGLIGGALLSAPDHYDSPESLVEVDGIEPTTPCLQSRCSPS